jgi:hypothetical protein
MKVPNIKTKVVHSKSESAWNIIGTTLGAKYKIARVPYVAVSDPEVTDLNRNEALEHAEYISYCFNHSDMISIRIIVKA